MRDEDCHGRDGNERPDNEQGFSSVAFRTKVSVADGEKGDIAKVESPEVTQALGFGFCTPEANSAYTPQNSDYRDGGVVSLCAAKGKVGTAAFPHAFQDDSITRLLNRDLHAVKDIANAE